MSEHTPTPWRVEEGTDLIWGACNDDPSTYGMGYAIVEGKLPGWKPYKPNFEERQANAAFIVKATNHFDDLVKCVRASLNMVEGDGAPPDWDFLRRTLKSAEAKDG